MNGFDINVDEREFKARPVADQNWILFQGIKKLHKEGCEWGRDSYKQFNEKTQGLKLKTICALSAGITTAIGIGR